MPTMAEEFIRELSALMRKIAIFKQHLNVAFICQIQRQCECHFAFGIFIGIER